MLSTSLGVWAQSPAPIPGAGAEGAKGSAKITGVVTDSLTAKAVEFASVALFRQRNNTPVDGAVCDDKGKFTLNKLETGDYKLVVTFVGYRNKTIDNIKIADKKDDINLGAIQISPGVQQLKEVTVEGQRNLIEEKVDRTVYNAEADATNRGGDATDVLRKVPMLSVDMDGNVSLRGSQNVRVLINNKPSTIVATNVADALKQIPSDMIKTVEVITSPSAKYDAEGSSGIINIITKKNTLQGATMNIDGSAGLRGSNLSVNGSYRKGKMGFTLGGFGRVGYNVTGSFENYQQTLLRDSTGAVIGEVVNEQRADTRNGYGFGQYQFGWDYDVTKNDVITSSVRYGFRNNSTRQDDLQRFVNDTLTEIRDVNVKDLGGTWDVNLDYTHTFKKPQREFSLLTQYSRNNRTNDFINHIKMNENGTSRLKNVNESTNQEITVQADFQTPIGKMQLLELGGKGIFREVTSDFSYFEAAGDDGEYVQLNDPSLSNAFTYNQNIAGTYFSYTLNTKQNYSIKVGSRYEYTTISAKFDRAVASDIPTDIPSYGVLVPSINISKRLKKGSTIKASYNRRIQRPSLQFLNPNIQASNPLFVTEGNPYLRPEFTNNYELSYNTFFKTIYLTFSGFARNTNNSIQSIRDTQGDTIRTTYRNIGQEDAYGFSVFGNINLSNKLTLGGGTDVYFAVLDNKVADPVYQASNTGWVANYRVFGSYNMTKGWGLQLFSFYRGRQVQLQGTQGGFLIYSLSLKKDLASKRGSVGFGAENFFTPRFRIRNELNSPILTQRSTNVLHYISFKVNFSYRIGKMTMENQPRRRRKSISNDDLKDGGDGGQGGGGAQAPSGGGAPPAGGGPGKPGGTAPGQKPAQGQAPGQGQPPASGQAPVNNRGPK